MLDYRKYNFSLMEKIKYHFIGSVIFSIILYIFFKSIYLIPIAALLSILYVRKKNTDKLESRKSRLILEFRYTLGYIRDALKLGYSLERAFEYARDEIKKLYDSSLMGEELTYITNKLSMNIGIEQALADFSEKSGVKEIELFSNIVSITKRKGGNVVSMVTNCSSVITDILDTKNETQLVIAGKVNEKRIMEKIPIGIIIYIYITSPEMLEPLYATLGGRLAMSLALFIYVLAYIWGERIIRFKV